MKNTVEDTTTKQNYNKKSRKATIEKMAFTLCASMRTMPPFSAGSFVPINNFPSKYPTANGLSSLNQAMQVTDTTVIKNTRKRWICHYLDK